MYTIERKQSRLLCQQQNLQAFTEPGKFVIYGGLNVI